MKDSDFQKLIELKQQELVIKQEIIRAPKRIIRILENSLATKFDSEIAEL